MSNKTFYILAIIVSIIVVAVAWFYLNPKDEKPKDEISDETTSSNTGSNIPVNAIGKNAYSGLSGSKLYRKDWSLYKSTSPGEWVGKVYSVSGDYYIVSGDFFVNKKSVILK